mgnify:CR=1 FL=1
MFCSLNVKADEIYLDFNAKIIEEWDQGWERYEMLNRYEELNFFSSEDRSKLAKLIHEEKCLMEEDIFCVLHKKISMDSPPEYDDWLTKDENQEARDAYYLNKKIQSIELKIPIQIPKCSSLMVGKLVFENNAIAKDSSGYACYDLNEEKILVQISPRSDEYLHQRYLKKMHAFDVRNPHGKYCNGIYIETFKETNPFYPKSPSLGNPVLTQYLDGYVCYEFETMEQAKQASDILNNEVPDWQHSQGGAPSYIEHLYTSHNTNYYAEKNKGIDFKALFSVTQKIYDKWYREKTKMGVDSKGNIIQEFSHFEEAEQKLIENRLIVINSIKNSSTNVRGSSVGPEHTLNFSVERSEAKKNFGNYRAYVVVTIPLVQSQYKVTNRERNYFGFFKGLELHLNNELLSCSYDCGIIQKEESNVTKNMDIVKRFKINGNDLMPISKVPAMYPRRALERGTMGYALLEFTVTDTGSVENVEVLEGYCTRDDPYDPAAEFRPCTTFDGSSIRAAQNYKYEPKIIDGKAVAVKGVIHKLTYALEQ